MYETREPIVETTDCLVVSRELSLKLGFVVNCNSSKNGQEEYRYIQEIKNFLHYLSLKKNYLDIIPK